MAIAAAVACSLAAADAVGSPSVWRRAADGKVHAEANANERVSEMIGEHFYLSRQPVSLRRDQLLRQARSLLEAAGAERSNLPALRYQLGRVLELLWEVEGERQHLERAAAQFEAVASSAAPTSTRARALRGLAICLARLGNHAEEVRAYDRILAIEPDPEERTVVLANQAEGYMAMGKILEAVRGYRGALSVLPGARMLRSGVTTLWGLAVALDRSGDLAGAFSQIASARAYDPVDQQIQGEDWFYVPDYDVAWYQALGHWQRARAAADSSVALDAYDDSIAAWRSFLDRAAEDDPYLAIASRRVRQCERERARRMATTTREKRQRR